MTLLTNYVTYLEDLCGKQHVDPGEMDKAHDHHEANPRLSDDVVPHLS